MANTIENLVKMYPNKTGAEILELHNNEVLSDKDNVSKEMEYLKSIVTNIKENGAYFRGSFGSSQYFLYKVIDAKIYVDEISCKIEKIVLFNSKNVNQSSIDLNSFSYEFKTDSLISYNELIALNTTPITEKEYNEVKDYLFGVVPKFFPTEWESMQKEFGDK